MKSIPAGLRKRARPIKLLLLDVDGVLTDGGIFLHDSGSEIKRFDVRDGHGIVLARRAGLAVGFVTGRSSRLVRRRARELGVSLVYQNVGDKAAAYQKIKRGAGLQDSEIAYAGDDLMDAPAMRLAGLAIAVKDSCQEIKTIAHYVTRSHGGHGAVREICELLLQARGVWRGVIEPYIRCK